MQNFHRFLSAHSRAAAEFVFLSGAGVLIGLSVSLFEVLFGYGLILIERWRTGFPFWTFLFPPLAGLIVVWLFRRYGGLACKGMNLIFEVSQGKPERIPRRTVFLMTVCTWLSRLAGASVGREGVAVQIGAAVSWQFGHFFHKKLDIENIRTIFLVTGMAAGFAGLFGTPFSAVFFALEVLVAGTLKYRAMAPAICAAFSASWLSARLGLSAEGYAIRMLLPFSIETFWLPLLMMGLAFGLAGGLFAWGLRRVRKTVTDRFPDPFRRILILGTVLACLMILTGGRYAGSGATLIAAPFAGDPMYAWDFLLKAGFTILSLSAGFVGGEVTPLFAIGVSLGTVIGPLFGLDPMLSAALGFAAVFGSGTNTFLSPVMIGMEVFGFQWFPFFFVVCAVSYLVNRDQSIYSLQSRYGLHDV